MCPKCRSDQTWIAGQSGNPPLVHRRCEACEYVFSTPLADTRARRILVVDDEEFVRAFAERVLSKAGYEVVLASDGPDALRLIVQQQPFDLFVIDVAMPQMSGDELVRELRVVDPAMKVLYVTGHSDRLFKEQAMLLSDNEAFVDKPCSARRFSKPSPSSSSGTLAIRLQRPTESVFGSTRNRAVPSRSDGAKRHEPRPSARLSSSQMRLTWFIHSERRQAD